MAGTSSAKTRGACHRAALGADPLALLPGHDEGELIGVVTFSIYVWISSQPCFSSRPSSGLSFPPPSLRKDRSRSLACGSGASLPDGPLSEVAACASLS